MTAKNLGAQTRELLRRAGNESREKAGDARRHAAMLENALPGDVCELCGAEILGGNCTGCKGACASCGATLAQDASCPTVGCPLRERGPFSAGPVFTHSPVSDPRIVSTPLGFEPGHHSANGPSLQYDDDGDERYAPDGIDR